MNNSLNETLNQTAAGIAGDAAQSTGTLFGLSVPITSSPIIDIYLIALLASLFITLVNKYIGDQERIKALREEMKMLRKKQREILKKKDPKEMQKIQQEIMQKSMENMKHSMNPKIMLTTMVPMLVLFGGVRAAYGDLGEFLNLGFTTFGWLGTYILFSIINSMIMKKLLDVA